MTEENFRPQVHRTLKTEPFRATNFIRAAEDYSSLGLLCFNSCVDPGQEVSADTVRGMEKRCMDGCLTLQLQMFSQYGTQFGQ